MIIASMLGRIFTRETADRLEMHHLQHEAPLQPVSPVKPTLPPAVPTLTSGDSSTVGLGANNKKDVVRKQKPKPKYADQPNKPHTDHSYKSRPKRTNSNKAPKIEPSKAIAEVRPCRPDALDSLLEALKLSSRGQT